MYVVDEGNNRVMRFPTGSTDGSTGVLVAGTGTAGSGASQLNNPRSVIVDRNGILFISDASKRKFQTNNTTDKVLLRSFSPFLR